jgi:hypothetical protein
LNVVCHVSSLMTQRNRIRYDIDIRLKLLVWLDIFFILMYKFTTKSHHFSELMRISERRSGPNF